MKCRCSLLVLSHKNIMDFFFTWLMIVLCVRVNRGSRVGGAAAEIRHIDFPLSDSLP